MRNIGNMKV